MSKRNPSRCSYCSVYGFKNDGKSESSRRNFLRFYRYPMKDDKPFSLTKSWIKRVWRADKFNVETATVWSDHFNDDDFKNYLFFSAQSGDELRERRITLKKNSVQNTNRSTGESMENSHQGSIPSTSARKKPTARFIFNAVPYHIDSLIRENEVTVGLYLTMVEEPDVKENTMVQEEGPCVRPSPEGSPPWCSTLVHHPWSNRFQRGAHPGSIPAL